MKNNNIYRFSWINGHMNSYQLNSQPLSDNEEVQFIGNIDEVITYINKHYK